MTDRPQPLGDEPDARLVETLAQLDCERAERRRLEEMLGARDARLRALSDAGIGSFAVVDARGRVVEASDSFLRLAGHTLEDLVSGAVHWEERSRGDEWTSPEHLAARSGPWSTDYRRSDGSFVPVRIHAAPIDGSEGRWITVVTDDAQARHAEHALRESEERSRLLVNHVGDAVFMVDPTGRVMTWNPAAERMFGYTAEEASELESGGLYSEEDRRNGLPGQDLAKCLETGAFDVEGWRIAKDGRRIWAHVVNRPIRSANGELRGFAKIVQDRSAHLETERVAAVRALDLSRSNEDLEGFALIASHDLQEPLRKLRMFGDRLNRRFAPAIEGEAAALIRKMDDAAARMQRLIDDLLDYSRAGRQGQRDGPVDLGEVAREVLEDLSTRLEQLGAQVDVGSLPVIEGDHTQMRQLLQNLVSNALKFHRPGVPPSIRIRSEPIAAGWQLTIEDDGIGFEPRYAERVFGLFQRLHGRAEYEGSGMGLPICRRIVERQGGTIVAQSRPGSGTTFVMTLPSRRSPREESIR